ncbi:hypothetical protein J2X09_002231 [Hydrogenophaga laconesensis]|uniref:Uncharacterized protein n=1 Tax=Hydrogenophaga laconesensis TaxID=1805971 RepID=A0ABU1VAY8_9BURK|nr:hypothetical protein [Hydrogenophaga laconesensis]
MLATMRLESTGEPEIHQGVQTGIGDCKHVTATSTVATIRPAEFLVLFMPERCAAIAAIARGDIDRGFVHKLHDMLSGGFNRMPKTKQKSPHGRAFC